MRPGGWLDRLVPVPAFEIVPDVRLVLITRVGGCFLSGDWLDILLVRFDFFCIVLGERQVRLGLLLSHHWLRLERCQWGGRFSSNRFRGRSIFVGEIEVVVRPSELNAQQVGSEFAPRIVVFILGRAGRERLFGHERSVVHEESALARTGRVTPRQTSRQTGRDYGVCNGFLQQTPVNARGPAKWIA